MQGRVVFNIWIVGLLTSVGVVNIYLGLKSRESTKSQPARVAPDSPHLSREVAQNATAAATRPPVLAPTALPTPGGEFSLFTGCVYSANSRKPCEGGVAEMLANSHRLERFASTADGDTMRNATFTDSRERFSGAESSFKKAVMYFPDAGKCLSTARNSTDGFAKEDSLTHYLEKCESYEFHSDVCLIVRRYFMHDPLLQPSFGRKSRNFVESGSLDGSKQNSMTHVFEAYPYLSRLWKGLTVEATPANFVRLIRNRPCTYRTEVALSTRWGLAEFVGWGGCCSGSKSTMTDSFLNYFHGHKPSTYQVLMAPATDVFLAAGMSTIDFWSLDVEGAELQVLQGVDWARVRIGMIMIESMQATDSSVSRLLESKGFVKDNKFKSWHNANSLWISKVSEQWILEILNS